MVDIEHLWSGTRNPTSDDLEHAVSQRDRLETTLEALAEAVELAQRLNVEGKPAIAGVILATASRAARLTLEEVQAE